MEKVRKKTPEAMLAAYEKAYCTFGIYFFQCLLSVLLFFLVSLRITYFQPTAAGMASYWLPALTLQSVLQTPAQLLLGLPGDKNHITKFIVHFLSVSLQMAAFAVRTSLLMNISHAEETIRAQEKYCGEKRSFLIYFGLFIYFFKTFHQFCVCVYV